MRLEAVPASAHAQPVPITGASRFRSPPMMSASAIPL